MVTHDDVKSLPQDAPRIERRLLELAHTTDAKLTAPALAYFAPCSLDDATAVLDDLAARDRMGMDIEDDGTIVYRLYGRQRLSAPPAVPHSAAALMPVEPAHRRVSALVAAALTAVIPGAGHLYTGRIVAAIAWFLIVGAGYALILPGIVLHLLCMASAAAEAHRLEERARLQLAA